MVLRYQDSKKSLTMGNDKIVIKAILKSCCKNPCWNGVFFPFIFYLK